MDRINALFALATHYYQTQRVEDALDALDRLAKLRRSSVDQIIRGYCELARNDRAAAIRAWESAVKINPNHIDIHRSLAALLAENGEAERARRHEELAARLSQVLERADRDSGSAGTR
ncbi:MAG: hypothetical protein KY476_05655 [Planctomycetes bacterium]|nr:hypothetical protein [Planctomycetota bacterium]